MSSTSLEGSNPLQTVNYANVVGYILNAGVVFGAPSFGLQDNATLSAKYQTLVTPSGYAFAIWGVIFTAELVWTVAQCLPAYRSNELITKGVGYNFVWACLAQAVWTIVFGLEKIPLSLVAMILILIPLLFILNSLSSMSPGSVGRYWLLKFPFEIHSAWIMAATLVNTNVVFVAQATSHQIQTIVGWSSLVVVVLVGLFYTMKRDWVVPSVLAWASAAIAKELANPKDLIASTFPETTIQQTRIAAGSVAWLLLASILLKLVYDKFISKPEQDDSNSSGRYQAL
ncbi:hypothetical protein IV203_015247 [Nitzschia inconspicua]|uniref:Uncharacterized protein n=1 Tax=Nitzschia inconspicua TaxID=303405 RepID=A0A9K3LB03_9STRA|nr:hypothetical protein IV203_015247 [Nitzschia inconspicua]